jgi:phosphatidylglycerol---prolipoprotein diacylglyceryl transferase
MHPILAQWHWQSYELTLASYGICLLLAILVGAAWCMYLGRSVARPSWWLDLVVSTALVGLLGAKLLFAVVLIASGTGAAETWRQFVHGGGVWLGGPLLAVPWVIWRVRRARLSLECVTAPMIVTLPFAHAIGRIGCLFGGCCFGTTTTLPWAITFSDPLVAAMGAPLGVPLHPVALYEALLELANFAVLKARFSSGASAMTLGRTWLALYAIERFGLEFLRGDVRGQWLGWSTSQWLTVAMLLAATVGWAASRRSVWVRMGYGND